MTLTFLATILLLINPFFWVGVALFWKTKKQILKILYTAIISVGVQLFSFPFLEIVLETPKNPHLSLHQSLLAAAFVGIIASFLSIHKKSKPSTFLDDFIEI